MVMTIELEKYNRGRGRFTCPGCGKHKQFTRYIDGATGEPFADNVGICNRVGKCGYHYPPKMFFADNPDLKNKPFRGPRKEKTIDVVPAKFIPPPEPVFHTVAHLKESLGKDTENPFIRYLFNLFPDCEDEIQKTVKKYFVGFFNKLTCFWQIDYKGRIRKGKLLRYDPVSGKRQTVYSWTEKNEKSGESETVEIKTYWVHKILQKRKQLSEDINLTNCFFGEHLLRLEKNKTIAIVESEKTAVLCALCFPQYLWLSVGAQSHLTVRRMKVLAGRNVIFYPDADAFPLWRDKAEEARRIGINAKVSTFIETLTSAEEKINGFDLADYIHREQSEINRFNNLADSYNAKLKRVLCDESAREQFETIVEEQIAIAEENGGTREQIETIENLRRIILSTNFV